MLADAARRESCVVNYTQQKRYIEMAKVRPKRYAKIIELVEEAKPSTIIEIGVFNGVRARAMAAAALKHSSKVHYTGYDLFEKSTAGTDAKEFNKKRTLSTAEVTERLNAFKAKNPGFSFNLVTGNTRETLERDTAVDFAYIDGGHSVETIRSDYDALKHCRMIVFDDYYETNDKGQCPNLKLFGANAIVDPIPDHEIINTRDPVSGGGFVCLAVVRNGHGAELVASSIDAVIKREAEVG
jgi:predicted O-methyltransferase YrrM